MSKTILELNTSVEMNNVQRDNVVISNEVAFKQMVEICSALFAGNDTEKYGKQKDAVVNKLKQLGENAAMGDFKARAEINTIVKYIIEPRLLEAMKIYSFLGNYHEIGYDEQPRVKTYNYEGLDARLQAANADVAFAGHNWIEYPVATRTISAGMVIDYREMASGNFGGTIAEEMNQVQIDMNNKGIAYVLGVLKNSLANNTKYVKNYGTYTTNLTETAVTNRVNFTRKMGKVAILGDFSLIQTISGWNGYKTVGESVIPFYSQEQVTEIARAGVNGFWKGCTLVELENPFNYTKPLADKTGFETYYDDDVLYFTAAGNRSPFNIFRRGGIQTMQGNDVETGTIKTRFDVEIGADVVKGREFEIGMLAKQA
jgi:hypothetical protein